jgi:hypothetical protein
MTDYRPLDVWTVWVAALAVWVDALAVWVAALAVWVDALAVWVDALAVWVAALAACGGPEKRRQQFATHGGEYQRR